MSPKWLDGGFGGGFSLTFCNFIKSCLFSMFSDAFELWNVVEFEWISFGGVSLAVRSVFVPKRFVVK